MTIWPKCTDCRFCYRWKDYDRHTTRCSRTGGHTEWERATMIRPQVRNTANQWAEDRSPAPNCGPQFFEPGLTIAHQTRAERFLNG